MARPRLASKPRGLSLGLSLKMTNCPSSRRWILRLRAFGGMPKQLRRAKLVPSPGCSNEQARPKGATRYGRRLLRFIMASASCPWRKASSKRPNRMCDPFHRMTAAFQFFNQRLLTCDCRLSLRNVPLDEIQPGLWLRRAAPTAATFNTSSYHGARLAQ